MIWGRLSVSLGGALAAATPAAWIVLSLLIAIHAKAQSEGATIQNLLNKLEERDRKLEERDRKIEERDAVIADLMRRLEALERRVAVSPAAVDPSLEEIVAGQPYKGDDLLPSPTVVTPMYLPEQLAGQNGAETAQAPGQIEVDEEAAERALERTLVQAGALLVPFGAIEVEPSFAYTRRESDAPLLVALAGAVAAAETEIRRNEFDAALDIRAGLPLDAQLEVGVPYQIVHQETVTSVGFTEIAETDSTGDGIGDVRVGLAKTFLRESGWLPDVIGRVTWDTATADQVDDGVPLGGGFNEIRGSLTALKRQDPLAFVGSASYETSFERDGVDPGDAFSFSLAANLAASPETSLRVVFNQSFSDEIKLGGTSVDGSNQVSSTFTVGAASILGPGVLLDIAGSIGLTEDAPDYSIVLSLPIRFNTGLR